MRRHSTVFWTAIVLALFSIASAFGEDTYTLGPDPKFQVLPISRPFSFPQPKRTVAIGDLHGDLNAFLRILEDHDLIDHEGNWTGRDTNLVLVGDLVDRGPHSRMVLDFVMRLEKEAAAAGGAVHTLLGNHELFLIMGDMRFAQEVEPYYFLDRINLNKRPIGRHLLKDIYSDPDSVYAKWLRERPAVLTLGDTLFIHAGVSTWMLDKNAPAYLNGTVTAWVEYYQKLRAKPPQSTLWSVALETGEHKLEGPLLDRDLARGRIKEELLDRVLEAQGVSRVAIGHTIHWKDEPLYGGKVIPLETGISSYFAAKGGKVTSLEILSTPEGTQSKVSLHVRPTLNHPLFLKEQGLLLARALQQRKITPENLQTHLRLRGEEAQALLAGFEALPVSEKEKRELRKSFLSALQKHLSEGLSRSERREVKAEIKALMPPEPPSFLRKICSWLLNH